MKFEVMGSRILVKKDALITVSKGGIITPDVALDKAQSGRVVASSVAAYSKGDKVLFGKYSGIEMSGIAPELADHLLFHEAELFGIVDGANGEELGDLTPETE